MEKINYCDGYAYYDGYKFRKDSKTGYYLSTKKIDESRKRLHVYVWEKFNGHVPHGYNIHHLDENKDNNDIENLVCMTKHEHHMWHAKNDREGMLPEWRKNIKLANKAAAEWHKTPEGRLSLSVSHKGIKYNRKYIKKCKNCGKTYRAAFNRSKFCSPNCQSAFRRKSGVDNEERECVICGATFSINKYRKTRTCSKKCSAKLLSINKSSKMVGD